MVGGFVFLIPLVLLIIILSKAVELMRLVAAPLTGLLPGEPLGVGLVNLLAAILVVGICFSAGLAARSRLGRSTFRLVDSKLLMLFPGYAFARGLMGPADSDGGDVLKPVVARLDDASIVGFEVERTEGGFVVVYLPGAPNPWSGSIQYFCEERISPLDMSVADVVKLHRRLGRGSGTRVSAAELAAPNSHLSSIAPVATGDITE